MTNCIRLYILDMCATKKALYFSGQISCRLSLSFPPVFLLNAFQNILKNVAIFLIQCSTLHYVICFFLRNIYVNNHVIAEHHLQTKYQIDWDSATCITYSTDYYQHLTLESWFTNLEQTPLNGSQQLPAPYKRLIDEIKQN